MYPAIYVGHSARLLAERRAREGLCATGSFAYEGISSEQPTAGSCELVEK